MILICCTCGHVIGCGLTEEGEIKNQCSYCKPTICPLAVPKGKMIVVEVALAYFLKDCNEHCIHIGFRTNKAPP